MYNRYSSRESVVFILWGSWCPPGGCASRSHARWYDGCGASAEAYDKKPASWRDLDAAWQRERWWSVVMCAANEPCCRCTCGWVSCCCAPRPCCRPAELPRRPQTSTTNEVCVSCIIWYSISNLRLNSTSYRPSPTGRSNRHEAVDSVFWVLVLEVSPRFS